jgi:hypothetical protein
MAICHVELQMALLLMTVTFTLTSELSYNQSKPYACVVGIHKSVFEVGDQANIYHTDRLSNYQSSYHQKTVENECLIDQ